MNPLASLILIGIAFVVTILLKAYVRRFAAWNFLWLMFVSWLATVVSVVMIVTLMR